MPDAPPIRWHRIAFTLGCLALPLGLANAWTTRWHCDDAFISFRYAENLANGLGLVFNPGERVEGYTNFLWTLWIALGLRLGADAEQWSTATSLVCHGATILILLLLHLRWRRAAAFGATPEISAPVVSVPAASTRAYFAPAAGARAGSAPAGAGSDASSPAVAASAAAASLPLAALVAALHPDWNIYATGGLETALFSLLAVAAFAWLTSPAPRAATTAAAALLLALACLTRPDGTLFAALGGAYVVLIHRPRIPRALLYAAVLLAVLIPFQIWRVHYYGDWFPNTYYAKSADRAWWSQGWIYARLYYQRYWVLLFAPLLLVLAAILSRRTPRASSRESRISNSKPLLPAILAITFAAAYSLYVMRVGGDFMYARLLIPTAPFMAIALEIALLYLPLRRPVPLPLFSVLLLAALALIPSPLTPADPVAARTDVMKLREISGITDEWRFYSPERSNAGKERGLTLRPYFENLPVRLAFYGAEARMVYYSRVYTAIECDTGLTDATIARQPLAARGRVGHEKRATLDYLLARRVHFAFNNVASLLLPIDVALPRLTVNCDGLAGRIFHWDPQIMYALAERGAQVPDLEAILDDTIARLDDIPDEDVPLIYAKLRKFYFQFNPDPAREAPFRARLAALRRAFPPDSSR